jgi:hypothetical protein
MQVYLQDMAASGARNPVEVASGSNVSDAFEAAGITVGKDIAIYVNRAPSQLTSKLSPGDVISYQNTALKGADNESMEELRALTFEDIMSSGERQVSSDNTLWSNIFSARLKAGRDKLMLVATNILLNLERFVSDANAEVADLEKRLEQARARQARAQYATKEFVNKNNIFSALAVMGQKEDAAYICEQIGVAVPDNNGPLWHTAESDGK